MRNLSRPVARGLRLATMAGVLSMLLALVSLGADPDRGPVNPDLEGGTLGQVPSGWFVPIPSREGGYSAQLTEDRPKQGRRCVLLSGEAAKRPNASFGNLMQSFDATPYRGRRVRLRAEVRAQVAGAGNQAQLWLRVDRKGGRAGFLDNMADRPIVDAAWREYQIVGDVAEDAEGISIGLILIGNGRAWLDAVSLEAIGGIGEGDEPSRPLEGRGLDNLVAFARLLGYVRYFHPSDQAAATDWDRFAIDGVRAVEGAKDPDALTRILDRLFRPIAPSVRIFPTGKPPADADAAKPAEPAEKGAGAGTLPPRVLAWQHIGVGLGRSPVYSSERVDLRMPRPADVPKPADVPLPDPRKPYAAGLGAGVSCLVPMALHADKDGTLPRPDRGEPPRDQAQADLLVAPRPPGFQPSGNDRATRLAAVVLAWNVFQHFYPYFDVVDADWPGELHRALTRAAEDADARAFMGTLRRLVAALHDGHGGVYGPGTPDGTTFPPFGWDWVEGQLVITGVAVQGAGGLKPGDVVVAIDGKPAAEVLAEHEAMISGATSQWRRYRALGAAAGGSRDSEVVLKVRRASASPASTTLTIRVRRTLDMAAFSTLREPRPTKIATIKPGVIYVDLGRVTQKEFDEAVPKLAEARGIVFDLRGYPAGVSPQTIGHLIDHPVTCAQWNIPVTYSPDRRDVAFLFSNWPVQPEAPRFKAKVAFLTDGRAISYAETYLGIIEHYKLADIVGGPTAGTNGNVNPFRLPGGFQVSWTGMKVLKHDGSRHHGVGIQPTVPATRTIRGVTEGRDEVLDRAVAVVSP
ncbi:MAG: S41 family peptidase [Isosphaeraceae bacterium]